VCENQHIWWDVLVLKSLCCSFQISFGSTPSLEQGRTSGARKTANTIIAMERNIAADLTQQEMGLLNKMQHQKSREKTTITNPQCDDHKTKYNRNNI
jgi:hypothetical protein